MDKLPKPWFALAKMRLCCALAYPATVKKYHPRVETDKPCTVELMNTDLPAVKLSGTAEVMI